MNPRPTHPAGFTLALALLAGAASAAQPVPAPSTAPAPAPAGEPVLLVQSNLKVIKGRLTAIDAQNAVTLTDDTGAQSRFDAARVLAVVACDPAAEPERGVGAYAPVSDRKPPDAVLLTRALLARNTGLLTTVTGERYPGELNPITLPPDEDGKQEDAVRWLSPRLGEITTTLDNISSLRFPPGPAPEQAREISAPPRLPPPGADDAVVLDNADTFRGLLLKLGGMIELELQADRAVRRFDAARVAGVVLANPVRPLTGPALWLADGSVLSLARASTERSARALTLRVETASGGKGAAALHELRAWTPAAERLRPLSSLATRSPKPFAGRMYAAPPSLIAHADDLATPGAAALEAQDVLLLGGVEVGFELPEGATHFIATAALEEDALEWGDCEVVIASGPGAETARLKLNADNPAAPVAVKLAGPTLTIRVEPARFGTVKDRVRLVRGLIVMTPKN